MTEQFTNNATTTLTGAMLSTDTTLTVASSSLFPQTPQFRILIDSEIMLVTNLSGAGNTTFTVTRGAEGTVATTHSNNANVEHILTAGALNQLKNDVANTVLSGTYASRPAAGTLGRVYLPTDGFSLYEDNGTTWQAFGPIFPMTTPPLSSTFLSVNSPTLADNAGGIYISQTNPGGTQTTRGIEEAISGNYTATIFVIPNFNIAASGATSITNAASLFIRDSVGGTGTLFDWVLNDGDGVLFVVSHWNGFNTNTHTDVFISNSTPALGTTGLYMRIQDDGTNHKFSYSRDGVNFYQVFSEPRTTFVPGGGNRRGFGVRAFNQAAAANFISYKVTNP